MGGNWFHGGGTVSFWVPTIRTFHFHVKLFHNCKIAVTLLPRLIMMELIHTYYLTNNILVGIIIKSGYSIIMQLWTKIFT